MVRMQMSPNMAIRTANTKEAFVFYNRVMGFSHRSENQTHVDLDAHPLNLFIIEDQEFSGPVMEIFVDNLEEARELLVRNGCQVLRWHGKGRDCYIRDPFGLVFNVWEKAGSGGAGAST